MSESVERFRLQPDLDLSEPSVYGALQTVEVTTREGDPYQIDTYSADGSNGESNDTVFVFQPWSDYTARPFMQRRIDMTAELLGAKVISVDNPGVGMNTEGLGIRRGARLAGGDWSEVSELQWQAIQRNELYRSTETDKLTLSYFSLGASAAAAMAAYAPEGTKVNEIILWESAALRKMSFARLAGRYVLHGGDNWAAYMAENPDWVPEASSNLFVAKRVLARPIGHMVHPAAMAHSPISDLLKHAHERETIDHETVVQIVNGSASKVSPTSENDALAAELRTLPIDTVRRMVFEGETHGVNDSLPRVADALGRFDIDKTRAA